MTDKEGDAGNRDTAFDGLVQQIGLVLGSDPTLGGLAFGMTLGAPDVDTEGVAGAPAIKAGTVVVAIEYQADGPLG